MNEILMETILNLAAFFEFCPDDVIDPDVAVKQLEEIASALDELSDEDTKSFAEFIQRRIAEEQQGEHRLEYLQFMRSYFLEPFLENLEDRVD